MDTGNEPASTGGTDVWINSTAYPHILSRILQVSPLALLQTFRRVSRRLHAEVDRVLLSRLVLQGIYFWDCPRVYPTTVVHDRVGFLVINEEVFGPRNTDAQKPFTYTGAADLNHTRVLDIRGVVRSSVLAALPLPRLETVRVWSRRAPPVPAEKLPLDDPPSDTLYSATVSFPRGPDTPAPLPLHARRVVHFTSLVRDNDVPCDVLRMVPRGVRELVVNLECNPGQRWAPFAAVPHAPPPTLRSATILFMRSDTEARMPRPPWTPGLAPVPDGTPADLGAAIARLGVPVLLVGFDEFAAAHDPPLTLASLRAVAGVAGGGSAEDEGHWLWEMTTMSPAEFRACVGDDDWDLFTRERDDGEVDCEAVWNYGP